MQNRGQAPVSGFAPVSQIPGLENTEVSTIVESVAKTSGSRGGGNNGSEEAPGIIAERAMYFA
jgi:hypothetical protein